VLVQVQQVQLQPVPEPMLQAPPQVLGPEVQNRSLGRRG
jgi:hypothetical protein